MLADPWRERAFSIGEAAAMAGLRRSQIDVWIMRQPADLFSEKRGHRRWLSPMDISVLAMAHQLERAGMSLLTAIGCAFEHLQNPPAPDAVFVIPAGSTSCTAGRFISDRDVARLAVDKTVILIPAGEIAGRIIAACADLRKTAAH